jgi:hypothetical protein
MLQRKLFLLLVLFSTVANSGNDLIQSGLTHGIVLNVDGTNYLLDGPADGLDGRKDIPGHYWVQVGNQLLGKHYNQGPFGAKNWWASAVEDDALLYNISGIIDNWSVEKSYRYKKKGYIHYHELVRLDNNKKHPTKVVWLKHEAVLDFFLDGGPHPDSAHEVKKGIDLDFLPNGTTPYMINCNSEIKSNSGAVFTRDCNYPKLGLSYKERGLIWGDIVRDEDGKPSKMRYSNAELYCDRIGARLPNAYDFRLLRESMGAIRSIVERQDALDRYSNDPDGYTPQILPGLLMESETYIWTSDISRPWGGRGYLTFDIKVGDFGFKGDGKDEKAATLCVAR